MALSNPPRRQEILDLISANLSESITITAAKHREVVTALNDAIFGCIQIGDIKEIHYDITKTPNYLTDNFDTTGKAKATSVRYGWAICNGANGTVDKRGRVAVGINPEGFGGASSSPLYKAKFGDKGGVVSLALTLAQMPNHTHTYKYYNHGAQSDIPDKPTGYTHNGTLDTLTTSVAGDNEVHNNMQPYVVSVFIQKIADY